MYPVVTLGKSKSPGFTELVTLARLEPGLPALPGEKLLKDEIDLRSFCHRIILTGEFWSGFFSATFSRPFRTVPNPTGPNRSQPHPTEP